jgi:hypothetical protein
MAQYILFLHQTPSAFADMDPEKLRTMTQRYMAWSDGLRARGCLVGGEKLTNDGGRHVRLAGDKPIASDGPYAEAKDVIGGFFTIEAASLAAAEAMVRDCPHLSVAPGNWIEIRPVETFAGQAQSKAKAAAS